MHDVLHESYQWNDKVYKYTNLNENHQVIKFILAENRKIRLILRIPRECTNPVTREQNALSHILVMRYPTACHTDSRNCSISLGLSNNRYMDLTSHILSTNLVTSVHVILIDYIALYDFDVSIHSKFLVYSDRSGNLFIIRSCFRRQKNGCQISSNIPNTKTKTKPLRRNVAHWKGKQLICAGDLFAKCETTIADVRFRA